jgi:hypothetical protein
MEGAHQSVEWADAQETGPQYEQAERRPGDGQEWPVRRADSVDREPDAEQDAHDAVQTADVLQARHGDDRGADMAPKMPAVL